MEINYRRLICCCCCCCCSEAELKAYHGVVIWWIADFCQVILHSPAHIGLHSLNVIAMSSTDTELEENPHIWFLKVWEWTCRQLKFDVPFVCVAMAVFESVLIVAPIICLVCLVCLVGLLVLLVLLVLFVHLSSLNKDWLIFQGNQEGWKKLLVCMLCPLLSQICQFWTFST